MKSVIISKSPTEIHVDVVATQDWDGFDALASYLVNQHAAKVVEQLDGAESRVWTFSVDGAEFSLHHNPDGNYLKATEPCAQSALLEIAADLERRLSADSSTSPPPFAPPAWSDDASLRQLFSDGALTELAARYAQPHRHHHTAAHVDSLLAQLDEHRALASDPASIIAAILYHDAIYDTHRQDNEALSAALARGHLTAMKWPAFKVDKVVAMIEATAHHTPPDADPDTLLFLDLDLSVLAAVPQNYDAYSLAIRQEFDWVSPTAYTAGRARVLQRFLSLESIFKTPVLRDRWEAAARANLGRELQHLIRPA